MFNIYFPLILQTIGACSTIKLSIDLFSHLWIYFIRPSRELISLYHAKDSFAIITGGSRGIGYELAIQLASRGLNLILIARDVASLQSAKDSIQLQFPNVNVLFFSLDATNVTPSEMDLFFDKIRHLDISILINNLGIHNDIPNYLMDIPPSETTRIINVNCTFQSQFTARIIPLLIKRPYPERRGLILNVSSLTSQMAMPLLSVYSASKAFVDRFSIGLAAELSPHGIDVLCVRPGLTVSRMSGFMKENLAVPSASHMATQCLRMIGLPTGTIIAPYLPHFWMDVLNDFMPSKLSWSIVREMHEKKRNEKK